MKSILKEILPFLNYNFGLINIEGVIALFEKKNIGGGDVPQSTVILIRQSVLLEVYFMLSYISQFLF